MTIKQLTPKDLQQFIYSEEYKRLAVVPITKHRALSHINNPRVSPSDIILLIAYEDGQLVGYLGVLADKIYLGDKEHKAGWLSTLWIDPRVRGKGIAKKLLDSALKAWDNKILVTEFTPEAKGLYDRSDAFMDLKIAKGIRGYLRFNLHQLLPPKASFFKKIVGIIKCIDGFFNIFNDIRLFFWKLFVGLKGMKLEYVNEIDKEVKEFIEKRQAKGFTRRKVEDLNWIVQYPWLLSSPFRDRDSSRYHFSSLEKYFLVLNIKVYDNSDKLIGFVMFAIRGHNLKIPYCYFDEKDTEKIMRLIYKHMLHMKLNMLTTFNPLLSNHIKNHRTPFIHKRRMKRHYIISKIFKNDLLSDRQIALQDGDADCAFT